MTTYNPAIHHRRSIRLKGYDYSQAGLYFITICTQNRLSLFGHIENGKMVLNDAGKMVATVWNEIPEHYAGFDLHESVVMPNHFHGIIEIVEIVGAGPRACPISPDVPAFSGQARGPAPTASGIAHTLPDIVHRFKTFTTKQYTDGVKRQGWRPFPGKLWQRNYYEHIIRDERSYLNISEYIQNNPMKWREDTLYA